mgnify:CR=1 FL=1
MSDLSDDELDRAEIAVKHTRDANQISAEVAENDVIKMGFLGRRREMELVLRALAELRRWRYSPRRLWKSPRMEHDTG